MPRNRTSPFLFYAVPVIVIAVVAAVGIYSRTVLSEARQMSLGGFLSINCYEDQGFMGCVAQAEAPLALDPSRPFRFTSARVHEEDEEGSALQTCEIRTDLEGKTVAGDPVRDRSVYLGDKVWNISVVQLVSPSDHAKILQSVDVEPACN